MSKKRYKVIEVDDKFIRYYLMYIELQQLHVEYGFGNAPNLPRGFTENLCRAIFNISAVKDVTFDGKDSEGRAVEIKATTDKYGKTTINGGVRFDYLLWIKFLLREDKFIIYKIQYEEFEEFFKAKQEKIKNGNRLNISLGQFIDNSTVYEYSYCSDKGKFVELVEN